MALKMVLHISSVVKNLDSQCEPIEPRLVPSLSFSSGAPAKLEQPKCDCAVAWTLGVMMYELADRS